MKKSRIIINIAGGIIFILSFVFIVYSLRNIDLQFLFTGVRTSLLVLLAPASLVYSGVVFILAFNYSAVISFINKEEKINLFIIPHYLKANIGKYLPTNLFHFAGRHLFINNMGYKNKKILAGNIIEFFILIFLSFILLFAGLVGGFISIPEAVLNGILHNKILLVFLIIVPVAILIIALVKFKIKNVTTRIKTFFSGLKPRALLLLVVLYSVFFIVTGFLLYFVLTYLAERPLSPDDYCYALFSFSVCWLIGFISPGVPGGIGVREALLLLFFKGIYGETIAFYSGIILRLITITGDVIAFLYSFFLNKLFTRIRTTQ